MGHLKIEELTLREKIGQTGILWPAGDLKNKDNPFGLTWNAGGLRMAFANMDFTPCSENRTTLNAYRNDLIDDNMYRRIPLLAAMDCNYGINAQFYELEPIVSSPLIGAADDESLAYEVGRLRGRHLLNASSKWWWGPEVDLVARNSTINFGRMYSDQTDRIIKLAIAEMRGCQSVGVATTAKHFPGADRLEYRDSHTSYQMLHISAEKWKKEQGKIFQSLIDAGVDSVMMSHSAFPAVDDTTINGHYLPASASYKVITKLLKEKMGFKGVVVTDAIKMLGLYRIFGDLHHVYVATLKAGNDAILGVNEDYIDIIENAVKRGEISEERITDACQRVLNMKEKLGLFESSLYDKMENVDNLNRETLSINQLVANKAVTLVKNRIKLLPVSPKNIKNVHIITLCPDPEFPEQLRQGLVASFKKRGINATVSSNLYSYDEIKKIAKENELVIYTCCRFRKYTYFDYDNQESFNFVLYEGAEKSIGLNFGDPYVYFDRFSVFDTFINAYNTTISAQEAVVSAILGEISFQENSPFTIIPSEFAEYESL